MGILGKLSKMQASTFYATFVFISVFWCQANADNHEDDNGKGQVNLHFYMKSDGGPQDYELWNDPCASVICQATNENTKANPIYKGIPLSIFNRFFRRPEGNGDKAVSGCC